MQVSQQDDHVTHAVLGQQESVSMGVSDSAALMHILSSTLYTHPKLASVREVICNGWDAHITTGQTDIPLEISLSSSLITVRDFGTGIPHAKIGEIYGTYGNSTKRDDSTVTGGFGLGSKAPFAYTDNFEVTSHCEGIKTIYRISKSSMERGGKPSINKIVSLPTTESGIQVSMAIKQEHQEEFAKLINEVLMLGEIKASINRELVQEPLPLLASPTGYIITSFAGTLTNRINLRYGNVVYPVPREASYSTEWDLVNKTMQGLWSHANITFMAPPDSVSIAPSREALILTDGTMATIQAMLSKFDPQDVAKSQVTSKQIRNRWINEAIQAKPPVVSHHDLMSSLHLLEKDRKDVTHRTGPYAYTIRKASLNHLLSRQDSAVDGKSVFMKRIEHAIRLKAMQPKFAKALRKAIHSHENRKGYFGTLDRAVGVIHRFVTLPLNQAIEANDKLSKDRLFYTYTRYAHRAVELVRPKALAVHSRESAFAFVTKKVLLARSKTAVNNFFSNLRYAHGNSGEGWVVYMVTNHEQSQQEVQDSFEALGYEVHRNIPAKVERIIDPNAPVTVRAKTVSPKRKGYLTLAQSYCRVGETFLLTTARNAKAPDEPLIEPVAYVILRSKGEGPKYFSDRSQEECTAIRKLWGHQIAVVTAVQADILKKKGVLDVSTYVNQHVDDALSARKDFPRYLAFGLQAQDGAIYGGAKKILRQLIKHESMMAELGLRFSLSAETEMLLSFFNTSDHRHISSKDRLPKCHALAAKVPKSPKFQEMADRLKQSPWAKYLDMNYLGEKLESVLPDSADSQIPYQLIRNLLK